jgi:hypothetical protein
MRQMFAGAALIVAGVAGLIEREGRAPEYVRRFITNEWRGTVLWFTATARAVTVTGLAVDRVRF